MFGWALIFLVVAVVAGFFGFSGIAGVAVGMAKIVFWIAIVLFIASLIFGRRRL